MTGFTDNDDAERPHRKKRAAPGPRYKYHGPQKLVDQVVLIIHTWLRQGQDLRALGWVVSAI